MRTATCITEDGLSTEHTSTKLEHSKVPMITTSQSSSITSTSSTYTLKPIQEQTSLLSPVTSPSTEVESGTPGTTVTETTLPSGSSDGGTYSTHRVTNLPGCVEDKVLFQCQNDDEYQQLKKDLQFSEFQMFIYLRNRDLLNATVIHGYQYTHARIHKYMYNIDWYNRYLQHYNCNKLMWVD